MSFDRTAIELRPLPPHRCTEMGFALARQWYWHLFALYIFVMAPILAATMTAAYLYPQYIAYISIAVWWFKPFGELGLLYWCSQALFSSTSSKSSSWKSTYKALPRLLLNYLGLFRLSPTRGLSMCAVFLEKTAIGKGRRRLEVLSGSSGALTWLLAVGVHIELILASGIFLLLIYLIPFQNPLTEEFSQEQFIPFAQLAQINYFLGCQLIAQIFFAPFFCCASFVHYINRRSRLEAWDIQHTFQALNLRASQAKKTIVPSNKAQSSVAVCFCIFLLSISTYNQPAVADAADNASVAIEKILQQDRFGHYTESGRLRFKEIEHEGEELKNDTDFGWLETIFEILRGSSFSTAVYWLLFVLLCVFSYKLLKHYWPALQAIAQDLSLPRRASKQRSKPQTVLPPASFEQTKKIMLTGDTRAALSCLLQSVVDAVNRQHNLGIQLSHTESECQALVAKQLAKEQQTAFDQLLHVWRKQAYEGKSVASIYADQVIRDCEYSFSEQVS